MKFMLTYRFESETRDEAIARFWRQELELQRAPNFWDGGLPRIYMGASRSWKVMTSRR